MTIKPLTHQTPVNPIVLERADPWVLKDEDFYYFTGSYPDFDRIMLRGAKTLAGLKAAEEVEIWRRPESGEMGGNIWAPELHKIGEKWYFYFTAGHSEKPFRIRMYVMEGVGPDPRAAVWGQPRRIETQWDEFSLDATVFEHGGDLYYVWAQRPIQEPDLPDGVVINSDMYISKMADPFTLVGETVLLTRPELDWENVGYRVNEGAAVLKRNGRIFITFSASATDHHYCMGLLTADENADLLDPQSWHKSEQPVFVSCDLTQGYGPGHNSFTVDEQGRDVIVYHARSYRDIVGNPLFDVNRHGRVQPFFFDESGSPVFAYPVGDGIVPQQIELADGKILSVDPTTIAATPTGGAVLGDLWDAQIPTPKLTTTTLTAATRDPMSLTATLFRVIEETGDGMTLEPVVARGHTVQVNRNDF
ncbi:family 43 glycosylhydrolase [Jonesiaceae bacterium BS-20]|uniref:Family 43 glycosylhydrolase n=1 Tax=Jonesiaceae bacterium BS-20 TaxID=3120821 RepID=A0AAU7DV29_9MICO